jgi:hypothetical protein
MLLSVLGIQLLYELAAVLGSTFLSMLDRYQD